MNKQKKPKGIEWTRIKRKDADGNVITLAGYTWNPTGGCKHGCTWKMPNGNIAECYAKTIVERFGGVFEEHEFRPHKLDEPLRVDTPAGVFVGSMADLFGHWVPKEQQAQVIDVMRRADWHTFQTLSKNPHGLLEWSSKFPDNVWTGVSLPAGQMMNKTGGSRATMAYLRQMNELKSAVRFMSIEPLWFDVAPVFEQWLTEHDSLPFEWAIIGAASDGRQVYQPERAWVERLLDVLDALKIPVFFKGNLEWSPWRQDFPTYQGEWKRKAIQGRLF